MFIGRTLQIKILHHVLCKKRYAKILKAHLLVFVFFFKALFDFCKFHYRIVYAMQLILSSAKVFWLRRNVKILQTCHAAEMNPKSEEIKC